ncbi:YebC/PmpR family DNA-binding transcriptional regulator [Gammaproteobacteria bacterium]|nr:YebC/PmpR family DNA-binding transcriptional regulator [SAR86 cluster bacterium]MDB3994480.1 YebC/PmpR family DNA-binding transcriptional regulator [Gammaproteobacteria bacterium]MDC0545555.1 YebC/PmpR family DNA-binding transcriptional regulator [Gammaproteobacteria bacterium]MDC0577401.1 YebC/PmpR family DNA-binding transcriptional regulator [Gammaproteobacteria bacterium]
MAGHSKWANIKHRKGRQDAKRGKIFSVLIRELTVAAKLGGGVPDDNPRLRTAIDKALAANMTKDTIERAVQRGAGGLEGENLEEVSFEGYGPGGIAIIVESMTDNNNRTVAEVRHAFTKSGGNLGTNGSVSYLFEKKGIITVSSEQDAEQIMEVSIEAGAEDIEINEDLTTTVSSSPEDFQNIKNALINQDFRIDDSEISLVPETTVQADIDTSLKVYKLLEMLEDLDDTQNVTSNIEFADGMFEQLD